MYILLTLAIFQGIFKALQQSKIAIELKNSLLEWVQCPLESQQLFLASEIAWKITPSE